MAKVDQKAPRKEEPSADLDHTDKIESQILEKIGRPAGLYRVEVCQHHNGNYRVNLWEKVEATGDSAFSTAVRIGASYYLKVNDSGEIVHSNPPLT